MLSQYYQIWQGTDHVDHFDKWSRFSLPELRKFYESWNEIRLFLEQTERLKAGSFVEIGCATGELYRYLKNFHPRFKYHGFDISAKAIERAQEKYPEGLFSVCSLDVSSVAQHFAEKPLILFSRDVVVHQIEPFEFIKKLLMIPEQAVFLRLRTRDHGKSVVDPELSCQWYKNEWVPYVVLNTEEVIDCIQKTVPYARLKILKNYMPLGGHNGRYLPKECYYKETGTAETAIYVELGKETVVSPEIIVREQVDSRVKLGLYDYALRLVRKIKDQRGGKA